MKEDLKIFEKIFSRMLNSKRGNVTKQDIDAFKYTFSRQGGCTKNTYECF